MCTDEKQATTPSFSSCGGGQKTFARAVFLAKIAAARVTSSLLALLLAPKW